MRTYKIPVTWSVYGVMEIEAESLGKAINIAESYYAYPSIDGEEEDSLKIDFDIIGLLNPEED